MEKWLLILLIVPLSLAATISVDSCELADVQAAVYQAQGGTDFRTGDIVRVPAGTCTWDAPLKINKGISVIGAGINRTHIVKTNGNLEPFWTASSAGFRLSGFHFNLDYADADYGEMSFIWGAAKNFRVDHCHFQNVAQMKSVRACEIRNDDRRCC